MIDIKFIIFFFILQYVSYVLSGALTCDLAEGDKCAIGGSFFGNREVIIPTTEDQMNEHCKAIRGSIKCLGNFTDNCLKGFVQTAIKMAINNADKHTMKRCDSKPDRQEFLKHVGCLTDKTKMEPMHTCADKNAVMMETLIDIDLDDRIPAGCCIFHLFQDCIRGNMQQLCGDEAKDYWDEMINEIAEETMAMTCSSYDSIEKCEKTMNPKIWTNLKDVTAINDPKVLASRHKYSSGFALTVELLDKL